MTDIKLYKINNRDQLTREIQLQGELKYRPVIEEIDLDEQAEIERRESKIIDRVYKYRDRLKKLDLQSNDITFHILYDGNINKLVLLRVDGFCYDKSREISITIPDIIQAIPKIDMIFNISGAERIRVQTISPVELIRFYDLPASELLIYLRKQKDRPELYQPLEFYALDITDCELDIHKIEETENLKQTINKNNETIDEYDRQQLVQMYNDILKNPTDYDELTKNNLLEWEVQAVTFRQIAYDYLVISQYTYKNLIQAARKNSEYSEETSIAGLFSKHCMRNITCIDIDNNEHGEQDEIQIDISGIDNINRLFKQCYNIEEIDLTKLFINIQPVRMNEAFYNCSNLEKVNMQGLDGQRLIDMSRLFKNCAYLKDLNMKDIDTSHVVKMNSMFQDCEHLENLAETGVYDFDVSSLEYTCWMFDYCARLMEIDLHKWTGTKISDASNMFRECHKLQRVDMSNLKLDNLLGYQAMFMGDQNIQDIVFGEMNVEIKTSSIKQTPWYLKDIQVGLLDIQKANYNSIKKMVMGQKQGLTEQEFKNSILRIKVRPEDREQAILDLGQNKVY